MLKDIGEAKVESSFEANNYEEWIADSVSFSTDLLENRYVFTLLDFDLDPFIQYSWNTCNVIMVEKVECWS